MVDTNNSNTTNNNKISFFASINALHSVNNNIKYNTSQIIITDNNVHINPMKYFDNLYCEDSQNE